MNESPAPWEFAGAVAEDKLISGSLVKLLTENRQEAVRTVQRMHRNLGHPSKQALVELLESRGASDEVIKVAREFHCVACARYKKPNGIAPVSVPNASEFNQMLQSDVMFFKLDNQNIVPVLSVIDLATRYQAATVLYGQRTVDFVQALERCWIRHFGPPKELRSYSPMKVVDGLLTLSSSGSAIRISGIWWHLERLTIDLELLSGDMQYFVALSRST